MWQSWIENIHYDTSGHRLRGFRSLAPLRVHATSYRQQNTTHFDLAAILIFAASAKIGRKGRDMEWFVCLGGYLLIVRLLSEELRLKDDDRHKSFEEPGYPTLAR